MFYYSIYIYSINCSYYYLLKIIQIWTILLVLSFSIFSYINELIINKYILTVFFNLIALIFTIILYNELYII